nr:glutathione S-transferase sigma 10 [Brachionus rubens]
MPSHKLTYFNLRGRGEIIRLIFAAAGAEYTDERVEFSEWPNLKPNAPLGQLPYLTIDGSVHIPQSMAIARYVARETGLAGKTNLEQAQAEAIVETIMDVVNYYWANIFKIEDANEKAEAFKSFLLDQGAKGAKSVEKLVGLYGSNGHAVGDSLTWADLAIYDVASALLAKHPEFSDKFPAFAAIYKNVIANENISNYVKNRPETPF